MIGVDKAEYEQKQETYYLHPDDSSFNEERQNSLNNKGLYNGEIRLRHKKGYYVPLSIRTVLIKDEKGEILGSLTISRDITLIKGGSG